MKREEIIGLAAVALLFAAGAYFAREYSDAIAVYLDFGLWGMALYVAAAIGATVVAPISAVALIPIAVALWGPVMTALLSILGWWIGSVAAFVIARQWGKPLVAKFVSLDAVSKYEQALGGTYLFWNVVLLRAAIPADVLSYALGLFSSIGLGAYSIATLIGISPFAFILAFASLGTLPLQVLAGVLVLAAMYLGYRRVSRHAR